MRLEYSLNIARGTHTQYWYTIDNPYWSRKTIDNTFCKIITLIFYFQIKQLNILLYNDVPRDLSKLGLDVQYEYVYNEY